MITLRNAIGVQDGEDDPGSPSEYTYEQLMRLQETVGMVSKGASTTTIEALRTLTVEQARADSSVVLGEQVRAVTAKPSCVCACVVGRMGVE